MSANNLQTKQVLGHISKDKIIGSWIFKIYYKHYTKALYKCNELLVIIKMKMKIHWNLSSYKTLFIWGEKTSYTQ